MPTFTCEKCKEGTLEFEVQSGDNGDPSGPYFESFNYAELVEQSCTCPYTDEELAKFDEAVIEAEWIARADADVDAMLAAEGY